MPVVECDPDTARQRLDEAGLDIEDGNTAHERWRVQHDGATAVAYDDKVVVQGGQPESLMGHLRSESGDAYVYFDGASRGNPGPAALGWVIVNDAGIVAEGGRRIGTATNNQAEYQALLAGLQAAVDAGFDSVHIRGDSELIVKQLRGEYQVRNPTLREYRIEAMELLQDVETWDIQHVPRSVNDRADDLANEALDA